MRSWGEKPYHSLDYELKQRFGEKVYKLTLNGGMSCPNRDGKISFGGCIFCSAGGSGEFASSAALPIPEQIQDAKKRLAGKRPVNQYIAYFQAYTNTYASIDRLKALYEEALSVDGTVGIAIGTRPDCISDELLDYLSELSKRTFLIVEYGIESTYDATLRRINRGHDYATAIDAVERTAARGIRVGAHFILGLPGESRTMLVEQAAVISRLPLTTLKLHQLQLIRGTRMAQEYEEVPQDFSLFSLDDYVETVVDFVERLRPDIVLERFASSSPKELLIAPDWGIKNYELVEKVKRRMRERDTWQGKLYV